MPGGLLRGYVQYFRVTTDLPEPGAKLYQIQSGDTAEGLALREFSSEVRPGQLPRHRRQRRPDQRSDFQWKTHITYEGPYP